MEPVGTIMPYSSFLGTPVAVSVLLNISVLYVQVEEVKRRQHCLMFSSAGPQAQTYFVNFDTLADYQRWHRQASKVSVFTCQS
jgi:hypothetical protein